METTHMEAQVYLQPGTSIAIREDDKIVAQSNQLVEQANSLLIKTDLGCQQAREIADMLKAFIDGPGTYHDEEINMANALHKRLCEKRNVIINGPKLAYKAIKDRIAIYVDDQRRKREEAERRAEEAAREKERQKQAAIQEKIDEENRKIAAQKREEAERRAEVERKIQRQKDEEKRAQMEREEAERRKAEKERIATEKEKAEEKKDLLIEKKEAVYVAPRKVSTYVPQGVSVSFEWDARVVNKARVPDQYLIVDINALEKAQKAAKGALTIPGVVFTKRVVGSLRK